MTRGDRNLRPYPWRTESEMVRTCERPHADDNSRSSTSRRPPMPNGRDRPPAAVFHRATPSNRAIQDAGATNGTSQGAELFCAARLGGSVAKRIGLRQMIQID